MVYRIIFLYNVLYIACHIIVALLSTAKNLLTPDE
jgi:hypothetical protein